MKDENKKELDDFINENSIINSIKQKVESLNNSDDKILEKIEDIKSVIKDIKESSLSESEVTQIVDKYSRSVFSSIKKETDSISDQIKHSTGVIAKDLFKEIEKGINHTDEIVLSIKRDTDTSFGKLSENIENLSKSFDNTLDRQLPILSKDLKSKIDENFGETKKQNELISSKLSNLDSLIFSINSTLTNLSNQLPETERKYGEIEALYKKEQEISIERANRIEELNKNLEVEKEKNADLSSSIRTKESELAILQEQKNAVEVEKDKLEKVLDETNNNLNRKENEYSQLKTEKEKTDRELDEIKSRYGNLNIDDNLIVAYNEYCSMSPKTKDDLNSIFPQRSFLGFISCGLRLSNVSSLWEFAKRNAFNSIFEDLNHINKVFCILIEVYNAGFKDKQYELIIPTLNSKFDSSSSSERTMKPDGTVQEVFLAGYKNIKDGNLHKAIVGV